MSDTYTIFGLLALIWIFLTFLAFRLLMRGISSRNWPHVKGEILASGIAIDNYEGKSYQCQVSYSYKVGNSKYVGKKISLFDFGSGFKMLAKSHLKKYPKGRKVSIYYSPQNVNLAILEPGVKISYILYVVGIMGIGIIYAYHLTKKAIL